MGSAPPTGEEPFLHQKQWAPLGLPGSEALPSQLRTHGSGFAPGEGEGVSTLRLAVRVPPSPNVAHRVTGPLPSMWKVSPSGPVLGRMAREHHRCPCSGQHRDATYDTRALGRSRELVHLPERGSAGAHGSGN